MRIHLRSTTDHALAHAFFFLVAAFARVVVAAFAFALVVVALAFPATFGLVLAAFARVVVATLAATIESLPWSSLLLLLLVLLLMPHQLQILW